MRYFELRVGGLGPFMLRLLACLRCWYTCVQRPTTCGTSAETDLFRWCCLCNFSCQTDLFQLDNSTDVSVWIFDDAHLVACWISWADQIYVWAMWTFNSIQMFY